MLSRAELLLSSGSLETPAVEAAVGAMDAAVEAWSRMEVEEADKRRKEEEILKYKVQEHVVSAFFMVTRCISINKTTQG